MGLLRTPPQKVNPTARTPRSQARPASPGRSRSPPAPALTQEQPQPQSQPEAQQSLPDDAEGGPSEDVGNVTTVSVTSSHAFVPRKPNVVRSPPAGSSIYPSLPMALPVERASILNPGAQGDDNEISMELDGSSSSTQRPSTPTRRPAVVSTPPSSRSIRPARAAPTPSVPSPAAPAPAASTPAPAPPGVTHIQPSGLSRGLQLEAVSGEADLSATSDSANDVVQDLTLSGIPPPPDSPPRQTAHDAAAFVTPKPARAPTTPGTKRKAPADEPVETGQNESASFSSSQIPAREGGATISEVDYGRRWKMANDTLRLVTERVVRKWT